MHPAPTTRPAPGGTALGRPLRSLLASTAFLAASAVGLALLAPALRPPGLAPAAWSDLLDVQGPATASLSILWVALSVVVVYQLLISTLAVLARLTAPQRWSAISAHLPRGLVAQVTRRALGIGLSASVLTVLGPTLAGAEMGATPTEADGSAPGSAEATPTVGAPSTGEPLRMVPLTRAGDEPTRGGEASASPPEEAPSGAAVMTALDDVAPFPDTSPDDGTGHADAPAPADGTAHTADTAPAATGDGQGDPDFVDAAPASEGAVVADPALSTTAEAESTPGSEGRAGPTPPAPNGAFDAAAQEGRSPIATTSDTTSALDAVGDGEWRIESGDHLWAVAEETLHDEWGRPPSDREVLDYWQALIDANQHRLVDPANPDLVFPGQVLALPPVPTPSA